MAIELHLQKSTKTPWGFRLAGGMEFQMPLTVTKVTEGSIAENAGIKVGDVVVRLNNIPVTGLTHPQAHDALLAAGNDFILAVQRGDLSHLPPRLFLYETSVENAEDAINSDENKPEENENADKDLNITDEEIVNIIGNQAQVSTQKTSVENNIEASEETSIHKVSEVAKVILSEETQKTKERKWSTFLQKPKNPKPKPKVKEMEYPKVRPYKVIIKKQPKKGQEVLSEFIVNNEEKSEYEVEKSSESEENTIDLQDNEQNQEFDESESNINKEEEESDNNNEEVSESTEINEEQEKEVEDLKDESDIHEGVSMTERRLSINLEEQLVQVQQQLAALAQLPSAIQQTLNAVTQQLSEIVAAKQIQEQEITVEAKTTVQEEITAEYLDVSEEHEEHEEKALSVLEEESYEHEEGIRNEALESMRNESEDEQALFETLEKQIEEEERRKEEELEARRLEQEKIQKRDKERRPSQPLTPLQRPIILPGGRKWCQPNDAVLKIRHPSITDEKIANTINTFSEVIVGHTVNHWNNIWPWSDNEKPVYRINFLKYQPPPKNLDYLQKSAVYRLVHDIEPPPKGIIARDAKILAEQDYYSEEQEHKNMQAQTER